VETIDWNQQRSDSPPDGEVQLNKSPSETNGLAHASVDIGLVLKLQQKLKDVEKEKGRLIRMVENLERDNNEESSRTQDSFRVNL
jgi:myosin-5